MLRSKALNHSLSSLVVCNIINHPLITTPRREREHGKATTGISYFFLLFNFVDCKFAQLLSCCNCEHRVMNDKTVLLSARKGRNAVIVRKGLLVNEKM